MACADLRHSLPSCAVCLISRLNELFQHAQSQQTRKLRSELWSDLCRSHHPSLPETNSCNHERCSVEILEGLFIVNSQNQLISACSNKAPKCHYGVYRENVPQRYKGTKTKQ